MLKMILVYIIIYIIPFGLFLGIGGFITGYPLEKTKGLLIGLAIAAGVSLFLGCLSGSSAYCDSVIYNNGICEHCHIEREFKNSTSTRFFTYYSYQCPGCGEVITVDNMIVKD